MDNKMIAVIAVVVIVAVGAIAAFAVMNNNNSSDDDQKYVVYYGNGGKTDKGETEIRLTDTVVTTTNLFHRDGYNCIGYNTAKDGSGTSYGPNANVMLGTKLYAQWESESVPKLKVTTFNTFTGVFSFSLGKDATSAKSIDKVGEYSVSNGDSIYITPVTSSAVFGVSGDSITVNVGDGYLYTISPSMGSGASIAGITTPGAMGKITFTFTGSEPTFDYIIQQTKL